MKRIIVLTFVAIALAFTFSACTTYDEGPSISLLTPEMRLNGTWEQTAIYINSELQEANDFGIEFTFKKDGTGSYTSSFGVFGTNQSDMVWKFNDDKTVILFKEADASEDTEWDEAKILRLTNSEMWLVVDTGLLGSWEMRYEKV